MKMTCAGINTALINLLQESGIPFATPESSDFKSLQASFTGEHDDKRPSIITRPQNAVHISAIVSCCKSFNLPLMVRGAGHDMFGRFSAYGAVSIDMRDINTVLEDGEGRTVRVGGGATMLQVLEALEPKGLTVAVGTCGTVGITGWSLLGGLGLYMNLYGLGCDQIVGAKVVNARGELVDADERMLKGLRGGGGNMGVVVELVVKTYPCDEIQAGVIPFDSSNPSECVSTFFTNYDKLLQEDPPMPQKLGLQPSILSVPDKGLIIACNFMWNGPADDEYKKWLHRAGGLAPLKSGILTVEQAVSSTTAFAFTKLMNSFLPRKVLGAPQSVSATRFPPDLVKVLAASMADIPGDCTGGLTMHSIGANSPSCQPGAAADSVCPYRTAQSIVEILGLGNSEEGAQKAGEWGRRTRDKMLKVGGVEGRATYLPLSAPEYLGLENLFGEKLVELKRLKGEFDPEGVFREAIPKLL